MNAMRFRGSGCERLEARRLLSTFTVTSQMDAGFGTLRQAILDANASPGADTIDFAIAGTGAKTISLNSALPDVADPLSINGSTQPGYAGRPRIALYGNHGTGAAFNGLVITAGSSKVIGLAFTGFSTALALSGGDGNLVSGCYFGVGASGTSGASNDSGITISASANNQIGGYSPLANRPSINPLFLGNVICNNRAGSAIAVDGYAGDASGNRIQGNIIGLDRTGARARGNAGSGIILRDTNDIFIGGSAGLTGNIIAASSNGILIDNTRNTRIRGNRIGTDYTGAVAHGNDIGISIPGSDGTIIGGTAATMRNIISGNYFDGISIGMESGTQVMGNYIGTDATGKTALPNGGDGVSVDTFSASVIGGATSTMRNIISGNTGHGVHVVGGASFSEPVRIIGNYIGLTASGTALGNTGDGVHLDVATSSARVGGTATGEGNSIAWNKRNGVSIDAAEGAGTAIFSNRIFSNTLLGIDLGNDGVTTNDYLDLDSGANGLQNYPALTSASTVRKTVLGVAGYSTTIAGILNAAPGSSYTLQFFGNSGTANWEGQVLLGTKTVTTNVSGRATFSFTLFTRSSPLSAVTATATSASGGTSEFSAGRRLLTSA